MSNVTNAEGNKSPSIENLLALELARDATAVNLLAERVVNDARTTVFRELRGIAVAVTVVLSILGVSTWGSIDEKVKARVATAVTEALKGRDDEIQNRQNELFAKLGGLQQQAVDIESQAKTTRNHLDQATQAAIDLKTKSDEALNEIRNELQIVRSESEKTRTYFITVRGGPELARPYDPAEVRAFFGELPDRVFAIAGSLQFGQGMDGVEGGVFTTSFLRAMAEATGTKDDGSVSLNDLGIACGRLMPSDRRPIFGGKDVPFLAGGGEAAIKPADRRLHALVVGLNSVDPKSYNGWAGDLTGPEKDIDRIKRRLESKDRILAAEVSVSVLKAKDATRSRIQEHLRLIASKSSKNDIVLFYFSGHGTSRPNPNEAAPDQLLKCIVAYDGKIDMTEILGLLGGINAEAIILIIDA